MLLRFLNSETVTNNGYLEEETIDSNNSEEGDFYDELGMIEFDDSCSGSDGSSNNTGGFFDNEELSVEMMEDDDGGGSSSHWTYDISSF